MRPTYRAGTQPKTQFLRQIDDRLGQLMQDSRKLRQEYIERSGLLTEGLVELRAELRNLRDTLDTRNDEMAVLNAQLDEANEALANTGNPAKMRLPRLVMTREWLCAGGEGGNGDYAQACREGRIVLKRLHRREFGTTESTLDDPRIILTPDVFTHLSTTERRSDALGWIANGLERAGAALNDNDHTRRIREIGANYSYREQTPDQHREAYLRLLALHNEYPAELGLHDGFTWVARPATVQEPIVNAEQVPVEDEPVDPAELPERIEDQAVAEPHGPTPALTAVR